MICNLTSGLNKTIHVIWPTSQSRQIFVRENERKRKLSFKRLWLVLKHGAPASWAADWSKHLSISSCSGDAFRTNTALAGLFWLIRASSAESGTSSCSAAHLWHRGEVEVVAGQLLFSRETSIITLRQHACSKARWVIFLLWGSVKGHS